MPIYNIPITVTIPINQIAWVEGDENTETFTVNITEAILKNVKFVFESGSLGFAFIRIFIDKTMVAPDVGIGIRQDKKPMDVGFTGDVQPFSIYLHREVRKGQKIAIMKRNTDEFYTKTVQVIYEFQKKTKGERNL